MQVNRKSRFQHEPYRKNGGCLESASMRCKTTILHFFLSRLVIAAVENLYSFTMQVDVV